MKSIKSIACIVALLLISPCCSSAKKVDIKFGLIADTQYADAETANNRYYRLSLDKLEESVKKFNEEEVMFTVNLGDLTDRDTPVNLAPVLARLDKLDKPVHITTGNHDYQGITDNGELYGRLGMPAEYYSFVVGGWRFIMLNTNEIATYSNPTAEETAELAVIKSGRTRSNGANWNGGISKKQMAWLEQELVSAGQNSEKVLVFTHHPLYLNSSRGDSALNDLEIVDVILKYATVVKGVISGHHHPGDYVIYKGMAFITVEGMIDSQVNAYGIVTISEDKIELTGTGRATSRTIELN